MAGSPPTQQAVTTAALQKKYAAASRTLAAQSRMLQHLRETVQQRESAHESSQARTPCVRLPTQRP